MIFTADLAAILKTLIMNKIELNRICGRKVKKVVSILTSFVEK